jgi:hypothetical protein
MQANDLAGGNCWPDYLERDLLAASLELLESMLDDVEHALDFIEASMIALHCTNRHIGHDM